MSPWTAAAARASRHTDHASSCRYIAYNDGACTDHCAEPNVDARQNSGSGTDEGIVIDSYFAAKCGPRSDVYTVSERAFVID